MEDEEFVRAHWIKASAFDGRSWGGTCGVHVWDGERCLHHFGDYVSPEAGWSAARAFTEQRLEEIRQVEEEIAVIALFVAGREEAAIDRYAPIEKIFRSALLAQGDSLSRILAREQQALADLKRGMKQ